MIFQIVKIKTSNLLNQKIIFMQSGENEEKALN